MFLTRACQNVPTDVWRRTYDCAVGPPFTGPSSPVISFSFSVILEMVSELSVADILVVVVSGLMNGDESLWRIIPGSLLVSMKLDMLIFDNQIVEKSRCKDLG